MEVFSSIWPMILFSICLKGNPRYKNRRKTETVTRRYPISEMIIGLAFLSQTNNVLMAS
jgi:hypothetical protein